MSLMGIALGRGTGVLLLEFCEGRDLHAALDVRAAGTSERLFSWYRRGRRVALQLARALNYLHNKQILHLDVKSANVLLTGAALRVVPRGGPGASCAAWRRRACAARTPGVPLRLRAPRLPPTFPPIACPRVPPPSRAAAGEARLADVGFSKQKLNTFLSDVQLTGAAWGAPFAALGGRPCVHASDLQQ